jgi:hypothetical protein
MRRTKLQQQSKVRHYQQRTLLNIIINSIYISHTLSLLAITKAVGYEVQRYITTGAVPDEEWSEERPWTDEEEW